MPTLSFEVGAIFSIDAQPAISSLESIGTAFASLESALRDSVIATQTAVTEMIGQIERLANAWRTVGAEARVGAGAGAAAAAGAGAGGAGGAGGRRGRNDPEEDIARRRLQEDRLNANAENRDFDARRDYARRMANYENNLLNLYDDGITIPRPPRTGITEINRARPALPRTPWDDIGEVEDLTGLPGPRNRPGSRGNSGSGLHGRVSMSESGVSTHASGGIGLGSMATGFGIFKGEESAMEEQKNIVETLAGINVSTDDPKFQEYYDKLHSVIYEKTKGTKFSNLQASKVMLQSLPTLALSGKEAVDAADTVFGIALNAGELSSFRGQGEPGSEAKAAFQFAHLSGEYDPKFMSKEIDMVNAIAFRTGTSIAKQESIMKYAMPIALLAGIDPIDAVGMVGSAENRLGDVSTAGTGFSQFVLGGMAWKGQTAHGLPHRQQNAARAAQREFMAALRLDPEAAREHEESQTEANLNRHDQAIVDLKIRDTAGKLLAVDSKGNYSEAAVEKLIQEYAATHSKDEVTRTMAAGFETRGARYAQPFTTEIGIAREHEQIETYRNAPTVAKELSGLQGLPIQQFDQMLSNVANTGNILATSTLKPLNDIFKRTNELLIGFNEFLIKHQPAAQVIDWGTKGAVIGAVAGGTLGLFGAGPFGAMSGAAAGAAIGGGTGAAGGAASVYWDGIKSFFNPENNGGPFSLSPGAWRLGSGSRPDNQPGAQGRSLENTNNITINASVITETTMREIVDTVTNALKGFLERASEMSQGTGQSAYDYSGGH